MQGSDKGLFAVPGSRNGFQSTCICQRGDDGRESLLKADRLRDGDAKLDSGEKREGEPDQKDHGPYYGRWNRVVENKAHGGLRLRSTRRG